MGTEFKPGANEERWAAWLEVLWWVLELVLDFVC